FFEAEDGIRAFHVTGVQTCALPIFSHLASADEESAQTERQLQSFGAIREAIPARRYSLANSAGVCLGRSYGFDLTRPGLALYGEIGRASCRERAEGSEVAARADEKI